jgi:hypothetical protein
MSFQMLWKQERKQIHQLGGLYCGTGEQWWWWRWGGSSENEENWANSDLLWRQSWPSGLWCLSAMWELSSWSLGKRI